MVPFYLVHVSNIQDKPTTEITPAYNPSLQGDFIVFLFFHFKDSLAKKELDYVENLT